MIWWIVAVTIRISTCLLMMLNSSDTFSAAKVLRRPCGRLIPSIPLPSFLSLSLGYPFPPASPFSLPCPLLLSLLPLASSCPQMHCVCSVMFSGTLKCIHWMHLLDAFQTFARRTGCRRILDAFILELPCFSVIHCYAKYDATWFCVGGVNQTPEPVVKALATGLKPQRLTQRSQPLSQ